MDEIVSWINFEDLLTDLIDESLEKAALDILREKVEAFTAAEKAKRAFSSATRKIWSSELFTSRKTGCPQFSKEFNMGLRKTASSLLFHHIFEIFLLFKNNIFHSLFRIHIFDSLFRIRIFVMNLMNSRSQSPILLSPRS